MRPRAPRPRSFCAATCSGLTARPRASSSPSCRRSRTEAIRKMKLPVLSRSSRRRCIIPPCSIRNNAIPDGASKPPIASFTTISKAKLVMSADYVIPPPPQATIAVAGSDKVFPVRRIWCVGRNYIEHIREMGQDERAPPFFFAKPADASVPDGGTVPYPSLTKDMHHEVELVVALKSGGRNIPVGKANDCIYGYAVGIDLTRRDLQFASREIKRPSEQGQDHAQGQRQGAPGRRPQSDDLERAGDDCQALGNGRTRSRRHHHDRHAVGRRRHHRRRQDRVRGRRPRQADRQHRPAAEVSYSPK